MTTRVTAVGLVALLTGVATLFVLDSTTSTVIGLTLLVGGAGVAALAGLFGVRAQDQPGAVAAEAHRDATAAAATKRASETGRWPRVIGGG